MTLKMAIRYIWIFKKKQNTLFYYFIYLFFCYCFSLLLYTYKFPFLFEVFASFYNIIYEIVFWMLVCWSPQDGSLA